MNAMRADVRHARERAALAAQNAEQKAETWKDAAQRAEEALRQGQKQREALSRQLTDAHNQLKRAAVALRQAAATEKQLKEWGDTWRHAAEDAQRKMSRCVEELEATRAAARQAAKEADDMLSAAAAAHSSASVAAPAAAADVPSLPQAETQAGIMPHLRFARPSQNDAQAVSALVAAASAGTPSKADDMPSPLPLARSRSVSPQGVKARVAAAVAALEKGHGPAEAATSASPAPAALPSVGQRSFMEASPPLAQLVTDAAQSVAHGQTELTHIEALAARMEATRDAAIQQLSSRLAAVQLQKRNSQSGGPVDK